MTFLLRICRCKLKGIKGDVNDIIVFVAFQVRAYLIVVGFTLVFGGMLSKTWRVYKIFTNRRLKRQVRFVVYIFVCFLILTKSESEFNLVGDEDGVKI